MKKITYYILLTIININICSAQKIIPPSPTAAALGKYGDVPVGYYNGIPSISIPIYTVKSGSISLPITLNYHASGIKVAEEASWAGLGWSLDAGGVITRTVCGKDDFGSAGFVYSSKLLAVGSDNNWKTDSIPITYSYYNSIASGSADGEPDVYCFNFNGNSGKFYFQKADIRSQDPYVYPICEKANDLKIKYSPTNQKWEITDGKGYTYYFGTKEKTSSYSVPLSVPVFVESYIDQSNFNEDVISSWYLDKIKSPTGDSILFTYNTKKYSTTTNDSYYIQSDLNDAYYTKSKLQFDEQVSKLLGYTYQGSGDGVSGNTLTDLIKQYTKSQSFSHDIYLSEIQFNSGKVIFTTSDRSDMEKKSDLYISRYNPQKLDNIIVYDNTENKIASYGLSYSYFNCLGGDTKLKLNEFKIRNTLNTQNQSYLFKYDESDILPAKTSVAVDHWGMYNGKTNNREWGSVVENSNFPTRGTMIPSANAVDKNGNNIVLLGADRSFNPDKVQLGILKSITYPTGGIDNFTYEPNKYNNFDQYTTTPPSPTVNLAAVGDAYSTVHKSQFFEINDDQDITLSNSFSYEPLTNITQIEYEDGLVECGFDIAVGGTYARLSHADDTNNSMIKEYKIVSGHQTQISHITDSNVLSVCNDNIWIYNNVATPDIIHLQKGKYKMEVMTLSPNEQASYNLTLSYRPSNTVTTVTEEAGGGVRIKEIKKSTGIDTYVSSYDYTTDGLNTSGKLMSFPSYNYLKEITNINQGSYTGNYLVGNSNSFIPMGYSASGSLVGYSVVTEKVVASSNFGATTYYFSNTEDIKANQDPYSSGVVIIYPNMPLISNLNNGLLTRKVISNINKTDYEEIYNYSKNDQFTKYIKGARVFSYGATTEGQNIIGVKFYDRKSEWWKLDSKVVREYSNSDSYGRVYSEKSITNQYNLINLLPKAITTALPNGWKQKTEVTYPCDLKSVDVYNSMTMNNMIEYPIETRNYIEDKLVEGQLNTYKYQNNYYLPYEQYSTKITAPVLSFVNFDGTINSYYTSIADLKYSKYSGGNIVEFIDRSGVPTTILWGYKSQYPIAEIKNATYADIEAKLGGNQQVKNIENANEPNMTAINALRQTVPSIQISTYTYKPLVGMTSATDLKGITTYYEYDGLNRLILIKDNSGKAVNSYDYHFKQ